MAERASVVESFFGKLAGEISAVFKFVKIANTSIKTNTLLARAAGLESTVCNATKNKPLTNPADTDVIKTSSGRLKKVTTFYDQTRRLQDVWQRMSDLRRLEDVRFITS